MAPKRTAAAKDEPAAKRAKAEPKVKAEVVARASDADLDSELNSMIQSAKDGEFDRVFEILDKYPPYVNERPEERMYSTIHQAAYWGELKTIKKLVDKYNADVTATTKDGKTPQQVAEEHGHAKAAKYFQEQVKKTESSPAAKAGGRNCNEDRKRITATRNDGNDEADLELAGVKKVCLRLGAEGGGILCGAAHAYSGKKKVKSVCYSDRKFKGAIGHSGDSKDGTGRSVHTINIELPKMPKDVDKVYLSLCSCGPANLSKFKNPSVELLGDGDSMIRYDLKDAGQAMSTVMAVLERSSGDWVASPIGAISEARFCGDYKAVEKVIADDGSKVAEKVVEEGTPADGSKAAETATKNGSGSATSSGTAEKKAGGGGAGGRSLEGKRLVFTGALTMVRSAATALAVANGAKVTAAVSGSADVVVHGPGAGEKLDKAKSLGCELWTDEEFREFVE
mmetsp:Transcript_33990/g.76846  ORF Transcript_33990/g.76846 Transcript_33990/m.76846 type:complete len:452 (-) Transcript_33990:163-1518(-)